MFNFSNLGDHLNLSNLRSMHERPLGEVFNNGTDDAKSVLLWCVNSLCLNVKVWKGVGDYISSDVPLSDAAPPTSYPTWINQEATGLEVIRYAELCVHYLNVFDQNVFYGVDGANPELFGMTDIERIQKRDLTIAYALKDANSEDVRKMTQMLKTCALAIHQTITDCVDLRDELIAIEFLLHMVKTAMIKHMVYQEQYRGRYS